MPSEGRNITDVGIVSVVFFFRARESCASKGTATASLTATKPSEDALIIDEDDVDRHHLLRGGETTATTITGEASAQDSAGIWHLGRFIHSRLLERCLGRGDPFKRTRIDPAAVTSPTPSAWVPPTWDDTSTGSSPSNVSECDVRYEYF